MRLNHCKNMSSDGHNGIAVEALKVLPCCLAPLDDGVRMLPPVIRLSSRFQVDAVKHQFNCGDYGVEVVPLGLGILFQHIELCLNPPTTIYEHYKNLLSQDITQAIAPTKEYSPFGSSASLSTHLDSFAFSSWSCSMV